MTEPRDISTLRCWVRRTVKVVLLLFAVLLLLGGVRWILAPKWHDPPDVELTSDDIKVISRWVEPNLLSRSDLVQRVSRARFLLIGETHFVNEPIVLNVNYIPPSTEASGR